MHTKKIYKHNTFCFSAYVYIIIDIDAQASAIKF